MSGPSGHPRDRPGLAPLWRAVHTRLSSGRPVGRAAPGPLDLPAREPLADLLADLARFADRAGQS